jgi:hypothetical protein
MTTAACPVCGKEFEDPTDRPASQYGSADSRVRTHMRQSNDAAHLEARGEEPIVADVSRETIEKEVTPFDAPTAEVRPGSSTPARRTLRDRLRGTKRPTGDPGGHPKERAPRTLPGKRQSGAELLGDAYGALGNLVGSATPYAATGRALAINAPVAGYMLDDAVKGTVVDKVALQPAIRAKGRFDAIGGLIEVPLIVFSMERDPTKIETLRPWLRSAVRRSLPAMVPALQKMKADEKKAAEVAAELYPDLPEGMDPVEAVISDILAPLIATLQAQPQPEEAPV